MTQPADDEPGLEGDGAASAAEKAAEREVAESTRPADAAARKADADRGESVHAPIPDAAAGSAADGSAESATAPTDSAESANASPDSAQSPAAAPTASNPTGAPNLEAGPPPHLVRTLVRAVAADPTYLAERLTTFAVDWWGPLASRHIEAIRRKHPDGDPDEIRRAVVTSTVRTCVVEGSLIGGPLVVLMPVAFCAALLVQIRMILEMAVLAGRSATDPIRAAEVLVIQGAHPDVPSAQAALRASVAGRQADVRKRPGIKALWSMTWRMARLLGLTSPGPEVKPSRWVRLRGWVILGATFVLGTVLPLIWMPYLGDAYRRSTMDLARRATLAYEGTDRGIRKPGKRGFAAPAMTAAAVRAALAVVATVLLVVVLVALDVRVAGGRWPTAVIVLVVAAVVTSVFWLRGRRRRTD